MAKEAEVQETTAEELLREQQEKLVHQAAAAAGTAGVAAEIPTITLWGDVWTRLRKNKLAIIGSAIILALALIAILAPQIAPYSPDKQNLQLSRSAPSLKHWFGTDVLGRDYFSRVVYGSRISIYIGVVVLLISLSLGISLGAISGYLGGWIDALIMRVADVLFAYPFIVGAIVVITVLSGRVPRLTALMIAIGLFTWPTVARIFRSSILQVKNSEYVVAARALGAGQFRVLTRHVIPNALAPVVVYGTILIGGVILTEAALSYLGIGAPVGTPSWGLMISEGKSYLTTEPWLVFFPGLAIVFAVLGFIFLGDGLRDSMDPRLR
jgi:ABC-type dipeptide/oligopeptide/nickel transport system permease subunit